MSQQLLWVALGGALGALTRFGLGKSLGHLNPHDFFSLGTLLANLVGCLLMGYLVVLVGSLQQNHAEIAAAFLLTGFLGSLTTFSSFILEVFKLSEQGNVKLLVAHIAAHLVLGMLGLWLGYSAAQKFLSPT